MKTGHLVLSRKPGQAVHLTLHDMTVVVRVGKYRNGLVSLEIDAPKEVDIAREERKGLE